MIQISDNSDEKTIKKIISEFYQRTSSSTPCESIMANRVASAEMEVGCERPKCDVLTGVRFLLIGNFTGQTQDNRMEADRAMTLSKPRADILLKYHTVAPQCYVIIQDESLQSQAADSDKRVLAKTADVAKLIQNFTSGNWTFISFEFVKS